MTDMQQILDDMNELNERVQTGETRATKGKSAAVPQQQQGIGAFASKYQPHPFEGEDDKWRELSLVFRSWSGRFFGVALAEIYEHIEAHRIDSATIIDLALTSLRFDAVSRVDRVDKRTSTAVGVQGGRAGGVGSVSTSFPTMRTNFNGHDSFETRAIAGDHVQW